MVKALFVSDRVQECMPARARVIHSRIVSKELTNQPDEAGIGLDGLRTCVQALMGILQTPVTRFHSPTIGKEGRGRASLLFGVIEGSQTTSIPSFTLSSPEEPKRARLPRTVRKALSSSSSSSGYSRGPGKRGEEDGVTTGRVRRRTVASSREKKEQRTERRGSREVQSESRGNERESRPNECADREDPFFAILLYEVSSDADETRRKRLRN